MEQSVLLDARREILSARSIGAFERVQRYKGLYSWNRERGSPAAATTSEIDLEEKIRQHIWYVCLPTGEMLDISLPIIYFMLFISIEDMFVPSALQIIRESELGSPPNKRRKKLQK